MHNIPSWRGVVFVWEGRGWGDQLFDVFYAVSCNYQPVKLDSLQYSSQKMEGCNYPSYFVSHVFYAL